MNKNDKEIQYPVGAELREYLNDGYGICNKCGALMDEEIKGGLGVYTCPACGWECDVMEYEYEDDNDMEFVQDEYGNDCLIYKNDMPPAGCRACGGPYPDCKATCNEYDD